MMKSHCSLTFRIAIVLVGFAGLLMLGNGLFSYLSGRRALEAATTSELISVAMQKEESVIHWLSDKQNEVEFMAKSRMLLNLVRAAAAGNGQTGLDASRRAQLESLLAPFLTGAPADQPAAIAIAAPDGKILATTDNRLDGLSLADQEEFIRGRTATYIRPPQIFTQLNVPALAVSTPLKTGDGTLVGVLISWPRAEGLHANVRARDNYYATEDAYLLDQDGYFLTPPRLTSVAVLRDKASSPLLARCLAGEHQNGVEFDERGIGSVMVCRWLPGYRMALIEKRAQSESVAPVRQFGEALVAGSVMVLLAATLLAIWLAKTITRPIRHLNSGVKRFGQGEYQAELPVTSNDEVGELTHEFNQMAQAILAKEAQLRANAASLEKRAMESTNALLQQANLLELAYDGIIVTDMDRRIRLWNNGAADMFGWARTDAIGAEVHALLQTRFPVAAEEIYRSLMQTGFWKGELAQRCCDGRQIIVAARKALQRNEAGEPVAVLTVVSDITDRRQAEDILRENEERTRRIVDSAYDAYVAVDSDGRIIDWNRRAEAMFGWPRHEALNQLVYDVILPARHRAKHEVSMRDLITTGEGPALRGLVEIIGMDRAGREFPMELTISRIWHRKMPVFSAFVRDITRRKQSELDLKAAKEAAEAATHAKSDFLANMSHEIRTPMNGIVGLTKLALKTSLSPQQQEYLNLIEISSESLLHLVNDILDFSKLEARKLDLERIDFHVRDTVRNSLKVFSSVVSEKELELIAYVAPNVPDVLTGDPGRLHQIITNLLSNAIKFTSRGDIVVRVSGDRTEAHDLLLRLSVCDTGIGIPADKQANIFEAFMQADTSTTRLYGGTGLGLAIVSQLTSLMQGDIAIESEAGKGAAFHLSLRLGVPAAQPAAEAAPHALFPGMAALIIDDSAAARRILTDILRDAGMDAVAVACPADAETLLAQPGRSPFALTLLDSRIPGSDAFRSARELQSLRGAGTIVMMLSSPDFSAEVSRCGELGLAHYVHKPFDSGELLDVLLRAMGAPSGKPGRQNPAQPPRPVRPLSVLIAEDHPINQRLLSHILAERGHAFVIANNGLEVLNMLESRTFDVILMDGQMPQMDGYQATMEIRRREQDANRRTRIIAVTAHVMREEHKRCLDVGMDAVICKPIDPDELLAVLEAGAGEADDECTPRAETGDAQPRAAAFDRALAMKRVQGKKNLLRKMIDAFLHDLPGALEDIQSAAAAGNARMLEASSHRLKGAAATLSAVRLADVAQRLEQHGRCNDTASLDEAIRELQACACELSIELESLTEDTL